MRERFAKLPALLRLLVAALAGAFGALGQAPFDQPAAMVLALALGFMLWRWQSAGAALTGWSFGTGYFLVALVWILEPFQVDAARHGWMAPFALLLISAGLALFWAGAFWAASKLRLGSFGLILTWTGAEIARAYVLTGFPWASPAQITVNSASSILLAWVGPHGVTLLLMVFAWALALPLSRRGKIGQTGLLCAGMVMLYLPVPRPAAVESGHIVRLIQPNAAQHLKWQPDMAQVFLQRQLSLTGAPPSVAGRTPDLIIWPETAIPWRLETAQPVLAAIMRASGGTPVALGALRSKGAGLLNSLAVLGPDGSVAAVYDKHHLVPFGEYIPFADLAERFGLSALAATATGFDSGPGPAMLDFGVLGKALPLICYEAVFAHGVNNAPERPDFLLQVTNDAWFGAFAGPQQHLAQAQMRAIEQGLPMIRAANTGISAMIDPYGRLIAQLALNQPGFLDAALPKSLPPTLYSRTGDALVLGLVLFGFGCAFSANLRKWSRNSD